MKYYLKHTSKPLKIRFMQLLSWYSFLHYLKELYRDYKLCGNKLFIQFFGYSPKLWKGKLFETAVHIIFSFLWIYISFVFWKIYFNSGT